LNPYQTQIISRGLMPQEHLQPQTLSQSHPTQSRAISPSQIRAISRDPTPQEHLQSQTLSQSHPIPASQIRTPSQDEFQPFRRRVHHIRLFRVEG
jgi:hypothetical protein